MLCGGQFCSGGRVVESTRGHRIWVEEIRLDDGCEKMIAIGSFTNEDAVKVLQICRVSYKRLGYTRWTK